MLEGIWQAAREGDLAEVEGLLGQDPGLLDARYLGWTPLVYASHQGHVGVVRWLLDQGAAILERDANGCTALWFACQEGHAPVASLLLERGADSTIATAGGATPLMAASEKGHPEVVRVLLGHPSAKANINHRARHGETALWHACYRGRGGVARALLASGADPTIAANDGTTPMAIAKQDPPSYPPGITAEGRRECVAALEVRSCLPLVPKHPLF
jgi:ankyrin repeat protein